MKFGIFNSGTTDDFWKLLSKLPKEIQRLYFVQETRFQKDWDDPRLQVKRLRDHALPFSFRVTRGYRVLFNFIDTDTVLFATIGNRKDIYK